MKRHMIAFYVVLITGVTQFAYAGEQIQVEVFTDYARAAAIGFEVNNKNQGGLGKYTKGKGPANESYHFGMRLGSIFGKSLGCGSLILSKSCKVNLVVKEDVCVAEIVSE